MFLLPKYFSPQKHAIMKNCLASIKKMLELLQCLTGHVHLNKQLYRLKKVESPMCKCNEEEESDDHFLLECPLYAKKRWQTMGLAFVPPSMAPSIKLEKIAKFIRNTGRLEKLETAHGNTKWLPP